MLYASELTKLLIMLAIGIGIYFITPGDHDKPIKLSECAKTCVMVD